MSSLRTPHDGWPESDLVLPLAVVVSVVLVGVAAWSLFFWPDPSGRFVATAAALTLLAAGIYILGPTAPS